MLKNIAFIFPGQGSQVIGMGKDFYENEQKAKEMFEIASDRLKIDMKELLFSENDRLNETQFSQPAILLISSIASNLFTSAFHIKSSFALGHSLGEFSALVSTGALDFADAIELVHQRGLLMKKACEGKDAGMMVILGLDDRDVEELCYIARDEGKHIWAANYNCDGQVVVAGIKSDLEDFSARFKGAGAKRTLLLPMSVASHCPLLQEAKTPLKVQLQSLVKDIFHSPVVSNVSAKTYNSKSEAISLLTSQLVKPVLYKQSIKENPVDVYIEFGANVLKGLNKKITTSPTLSITDMASMEEAISYLKN